MPSASMCALDSGIKPMPDVDHMRCGNSENTTTIDYSGFTIRLATRCGKTCSSKKFDAYRLDGHGEDMDSHGGRDWTLVLTKSPRDGALFAYGSHNYIDSAAAKEHHNIICVRWLGHDRLPPPPRPATRLSPGCAPNPPCAPRDEWSTERT